MSLEKAKAYLASRGLEGRIIEPPVSTATVPLAARALGVEEGMIAKTLSFIVDGAPILILAAGTARIDNRRFKDRFHTKARMVPFDDCEKLIGHAAGGVCPFGVNEGIAVYLDETLKAFEFVYPAAGNDRSGVRLTPEELFGALDGAEWIDVCKMPEE
ncbi:MAG: YbaK/EbsC family protein [Clostridia bacterium]|nr:YbaK/EbsC family protein [Clostridia bacterium]MBQ2190972.1 YbaK/EbsC family protein [Clostridia bacterium]MBQ3938942.1 YbaK/EbsC family protein [Clostridia bacterium]MBQ5488739.1 YbaK/EbsC family protein [Clostridia bacterium]